MSSVYNNPKFIYLSDTFHAQYYIFDLILFRKTYNNVDYLAIEMKDVPTRRLRSKKIEKKKFSFILNVR